MFVFGREPTGFRPCDLGPPLLPSIQPAGSNSPSPSSHGALPPFIAVYYHRWGPRGEEASANSPCPAPIHRWVVSGGKWTPTAGVWECGLNRHDHRASAHYHLPPRSSLYRQLKQTTHPNHSPLAHHFRNCLPALPAPRTSPLRNTRVTRKERREERCASALNSTKITLEPASFPPTHIPRPYFHSWRTRFSSPSRWG